MRLPYLLVTAALLLAPTLVWSQTGKVVIQYDCIPNYANWGGVTAAYEKETGVRIPPDMIWPLLWLGVGSVREAGGGWTLSRYAAVFTDRTFREAAVHSLCLSLGVAAGATALCLAPAALLARRTFPGQTLLRAMFTVPMAFSGIIVGFLTVLMLGRVGFLSTLVERVTGHDLIGGSAYGIGGLLAAYAYFEVPRATLTLESSLRKLDPRLDHAAASLGAGRLQRWRLVGLPLLAPALLETFALTFNVALGSFGVVLVVSKRFSLLPLETFHEIIAMNNLPQAAALAALLAGVALGVNLLARVLADRLLARRGRSGGDV